MGFESIIAEHRIGAVESQCRALDARLTALVEALHAYHKPDAPFGAYPELMARLAALRAPGVELRQCPECDCDPAALATARRERDEAVEVAQALVKWDVGGTDATLNEIVAHARALVAGQAGGGPSEAVHPGAVRLICDVMPDGRFYALGGDRAPGDPMADRPYLGADRIEARIRRGEPKASGGYLESLVEQKDAEISTLRTSLAEAQGEVADLRVKLKGAEDRAKMALDHKNQMRERWDAEVKELQADRDALRTRLDAAGKLIERTRKLIERLRKLVPSSGHVYIPSDVVADLRAWGK